MFSRWLVIAVLLGLLNGCAKKVDFPNVVITAATPEAFSRFRAELVAEFTTERLKDFDTAVQELKLDAMNRNVPTAEARDQDMINVAKGKTVHAATILGWQARRARFLREIAFIQEMLDASVKTKEKTAASGTPDYINARIASAQNLIAQLQKNLDETERRLGELVAASPSAK